MREKILIISNDPRHPSGVASQCRAICKSLWAANYQPIVVAYSMLPPQPPATHKWETGEEVFIYTCNLRNEIFQDVDLMVKLVDEHKPKCFVLFDDPKRFLTLLDHAAFIRQRMPLAFIHVWDTFLLPDEASLLPHYNLPIYENFDFISCISRQTEWFCNQALKKQRFGKKPTVTYVGHGSDADVFKPQPPAAELRAKIFKEREFDFIALAVNQNQWRKKLVDTVYAWRMFFKELPVDKQERSAFVLRTPAASPHGTDMGNCIEALAPDSNVFLIPDVLDEPTMVHLYNLCDVHVNAANAEGFGLTNNEAMLCGLPTITNATGGLVDQMGYECEWKPENVERLYGKSAGEWCYPLRGNGTIIGSVATPYLWDFNATVGQIADGFKFWSDMTAVERKGRGLLGRAWAIKQGLTAKDFGAKCANDIQRSIKEFVPRQPCQIYVI